MFCEFVMLYFCLLLIIYYIFVLFYVIIIIPGLLLSHPDPLENGSSHQGHHVLPVLASHTQEPPQHLVAAQVKCEVLLMRNQPHLSHLTAGHTTPVGEVAHTGDERTVGQQGVEGLQTEAGRPLDLNVLQLCQTSGLCQIEECLVRHMSHASEVDILDIGSCPQQPLHYT